jgi:hypothetical protein
MRWRDLREDEHHGEGKEHAYPLAPDQGDALAPRAVQHDKTNNAQQQQAKQQGQIQMQAFR